MAIKCPKCQSSNPETAAFCAGCGTKLESPGGRKVTVTMEMPEEGLPRGTLIANRYEIIEELGQGGMGKVFRVEDTKIKAEIALKLIRQEISSDKKTIERFSNELKTTRMISHRNVCRMFDLGEEKGTYFITMEYVPGQDLRGLIRQTGQLTLGKAIAIAGQICEGLAEAHRLGVVHRDLKPANIIIDKDGNARIMDFGIARSLYSKSLTREGVIIGTPEYMSPEQVEAKEVDPRSDIYSLGIILYEMVTGRVPFEGDTPFSVAYKHRHEAPEDPRKFNPLLPDSIVEIICRCMEKDREERYQTAKELLADLETIEGGMPVYTKKAPKEKKPLTSKEITVTVSLRKLLVPALVALAVLVISVASFMIFRKTGTSTGLDADLVAVAAFENQTGDPSLDPLGRMASDWISQGLSQISGLKVVPTLSVPPISPTVKPGEKTRPELSPLQVLAEQTGAGKVVSGTYYLAYGELQFLSNITDTRNRMLVRSLDPVKGRLADRMDVIEKLRQLIMGAMAVELGFSFGDWKGARPPSYEAYQEYILGLNSSMINPDRAIGHLEKAVELDPEFMPAHLWLARVFSNRKEWDKAVSELELADRNRDKLTPELALFLDRLKAESQGKHEEALRVLLELKKLAPREALYTFTVAATETGLNMPRQALDLFENAEVPEYWLKIGTGSLWFGQWSIAHYFLGNHKKELEVIRKAREYYPDDLAPMAMEVRALAALGRIEEVKKVVDESLLSRSVIGTWTAGRVILSAARELHVRGYSEAFKDMARRAVEWYVGQIAGKEATERQQYELVEALYISERWQEADALVDKLKSEKPDYIDYLGYAGVLAARRNDREEALKFFEELKGIDRQFTFGEQAYWRARIAALLGMKEEALELLRKSFSQGKYYDIFLIQEADFDPIRDFEPFKDLMKPKG